MIPQPVHTWSPGRRMHYKMMRLTGYAEQWDETVAFVREAYEAVAEADPSAVPTIEEIIERDEEMNDDL